MDYKALKEKHGLSLTDISNATNINIPSLSRVFNGKQKPSKYHKIALKIFFSQFDEN